MALQFEVNLSILFTELPLLERPAAAAAAGFQAAEFWWPFSVAVPGDEEVDAFVGALEDAGLRLVGLNFFAGNMPGGERGLVSWPARRHEFHESVEVLVAIAERTGCRRFNALYGQRLPDVDHAEQDAIAVENLAFAGQAVAGFGGVVLIEPLAKGENGDYPLLTADDALTVVERVKLETGVENLALLLDTYHLASNGENVVALASTYGRRLGHVQVADWPGRHQPGTGELPFDEVFSALEDGGYDGWVGCEYKPEGPSAASFGWLPGAGVPASPRGTH
ncbi:MAG: TIM barrel protein [Solirubrobacterales bacterium]|nr:TIM barrel protein [Solirubrobacterales bacterium]